MLKNFLIIGLLQILQAKLRIIFFLLPADRSIKFMHFLGEFSSKTLIPRSLKKQIQKNLKEVYGHSSLDQAESLLKKVCLSFFETLCLPLFKKKHLGLLCEVTGLTYLKEALTHKKGAMVLTVHAGNFEIIPNVLATLGFPMLKIVKTVYPEDLPAKFLNTCRRSQGVRVLNVEEKDMYRESFRNLNANGVVYLLADTGALDSRHVLIKVFDKIVPAATGWKTMAERSEAMVLPTFIKRDKNNKNHIRIYPPLMTSKDTGDEIFQEMGNLLEEFTRENPDEWVLPLNTYEVERMTSAHAEQ